MHCLETRYVWAHLDKDNLSSIISRKQLQRWAAGNYCRLFHNQHLFPCTLVTAQRWTRFSLVGLFDWKKDRKFFARFEEPVSPEKDSPMDDGEFFLIYSFPLSPSNCRVPSAPLVLPFHPFACCPFVCVKFIAERVFFATTCVYVLGWSECWQTDPGLTQQD